MTRTTGNVRVATRRAAAGDRRGSLTEQVTRSAGWSLGAQAVARGASFASGVALARILAPDEFGVFAVALVAVNVLIGLNDIGVIAGVVRTQGDVRALVGTATTIAIGSSLALYGALWFAAAPFAGALGAPEATNVLRVLGLVLVVDGVAAVPMALVSRTFGHDRWARADISGQVVTVAASIALALAGAGVWSLALGRLAGNATTAALVVRASPYLARPELDRSAARELLSFGVPVAGSNVVHFGLLNVDYLVVGSVLGTVPLGMYLLAFNIANWPVAIMGGALHRVSLPALSRLVGEPDRLRDAVARALTLVIMLAAPVGALIAVLADPIVHVVYGSRWGPATEPLRLLALLGVARVVVNLVEPLMMALGRSRALLGVYILWMVALVPALVVGARAGGLAGVGVAHAATALVVALPAFSVAARRSGIPLRPAPGLARAVVGLALAVGASLAVLATVEAGVVRLALGATLLLALYARVATTARQRNEGRARIVAIAGRMAGRPAQAEARA